MGRFDFQSPGAMASEEIQKVLAQRMLDKRQAMIDALNAENVHSEITERAARTAQGQEQLGISRKNSESDAARAQAEVERSGEDVFQSQLKGVAPYTDASQLGDDLKAKMRPRGMLPMTPVQGPTEEGGNLPPVEVYKGTPTEQHEDQKQQAIQEATAEMQSATTDDEKNNAAIKLVSLGVNPREAEITRRMPLTTISPLTGKVVSTNPDIQLPEENAVRVLEQPNVGRGDSGAGTGRNYQIQFKSGETTVASLTPDEYKAYKANPNVLGLVDVGLMPGAGFLPKAPTATAIIKANAALTTLAKLEQSAKDSNWMGGPSDSSLAAARTQAAQAMSEYERVAPPDVVNVAHKILGDPRTRNLSVAELVEGGVLPPKTSLDDQDGYDAQDLREIHELLTALKQYTDIKAKYAPPAKKPAAAPIAPTPGQD